MTIGVEEIVDEEAIGIVANFLGIREERIDGGKNFSYQGLSVDFIERSVIYKGEELWDAAYDLVRELEESGMEFSLEKY
ncbi:MAG: hypothetical protein CMH64_04295 [Nanoarchaeota archaeon]|nr:hypothetical protein [Nanoarchaeota archaeon]|tara:strand:+ start:59 stop:295 length:237 start_codon:yes stop_codon:yes gene_type:complete